MPFKMTCPQCGKIFSLRDELAGRAVRCTCGKTIQLSVSTGKPMAAALGKPSAMQDSSDSKKSAQVSDRSLLRFRIAAGVVGGGLLLVFGITVSLVVYLSKKPTEQAAGKAIASNPPTKSEEPSRLLDVGELNPATADRFPPPSVEPPNAKTPPGMMTKSLATMDRLTLAVAPVAAEEAPTPPVWTGHTASIRGVAYTDDGRFVVSVSGAINKDTKGKEDNSIRVWDARRGKVIHKLDGFREALDAVSVSPGGRFAVFGHGGHYEKGRWVNATDHHVRLWDIQDNREMYLSKNSGGTAGSTEGVEARFQGLQSSVESTAFSPDRKRLIGEDNSGQLVLWETETGEPVFRSKVEAMARLRDDSDDGRRVSLTLSGGTCVFTPDGRWLLTGGADYTVRLLDAATGEQVHLFESHQDIVWAVAATRTKDGRLLGLSGGGNRQRLREAGFIPGARDYAIRLWDLEGRKEIRRFIGHEDSVAALVFCPNGRHFLSGSTDQTVRLWDIASGALLRTYRGHTDYIRAISVSPDGRAAVSGGDDCKLRYWRLPATVEDVMLALDKKSHADLTTAMRDLDTMGSELRAAFPKLVQTLCQSDKTMGELALTILRRLGQPDKTWVNGLRTLLTGPLPDGRSFAAEALAQMGTDALPALAELRRTLSDTDPAVRRNVVATLAHLGKEAREAADDLAGLVERETEEEFKIEAIRTLGKIEGKSKLKKLFRDQKDPALLVEVLDALASAGSLDSGIVETLISKGLRHADAVIRSKTLACLRRVGLESLSLTSLVALNLDDVNSDVQTQAAKVLGERMEHLSDADLKDVRDLLGMADKPKAVEIGLEAVKRLGPKAKGMIPELLKTLPTAGNQKLEMALALSAIDAKDKKVVEAIGPILVGALRPKTTKDKPSEAVLKSLVAIGNPVVDELFKALEKIEDIGIVNANNRKAIFQALQRLGREAYSEENVETLRRYQRQERYRDVQEAVGKAIHDMHP